MDLIEEIKSRINILDLVSEMGLEIYRNNFIKSIYKDEKTPSLKIYSQTNTYKCYSTGNWGDVIQFYADYYRIEIKDAIKELAVKAGLKIQSRNFDKRSLKNEKTRINQNTKRMERRIKVLRHEKECFDERAGICEYEMGFNKNEAEKIALEFIMNERIEKQIMIYESLEKFCFGIDEESFEYLIGKDRGLKPETIKKFRLFSIKNLRTTLEFLHDCFDEDDLKISGLLNTKGNFVFGYHKLIIPYLENNKITYLRGRCLVNNSTISKYIGLNNFAGNLTPKRFFNKDTLINATGNNKIFICEGEFDTIIMEQIGMKALGIPGVTNIPEKDLGLIKDYEIYVAFDNDTAGEKAMHKIVQLIGKPVKAIKLKHHNDLTELINERS